MTEPGDESPNVSMSEQAAEWFLRMRDGTVPAADRRKYVRWLKQSPLHIAEYLRLTPVNGSLLQAGLSLSGEESSLEAEVQRAARTYPVDTATLVRQAREELARPSWRLAGLLRKLQAPWIQTPSERVRAYSWGALAAAYVLIAGLMLTTWAGREIHTDPGEWRAAAFTDGSFVTVAPRSELRLDFSDAQRVVHLQGGKAYFTVAKDLQRPFIVSTALARIRAVGTRFEVAVSPRKDRITVTVKEGIVAVSSKRESAAEQEQGAAELVPLEGGQQLQMALDSSVVVADIDPERELGWAHKRLTFEGDTLADAVAEFNGLNRVQIVVDATLAGRPVHGVFNADDPASFAQTMSRMPQVVLKEGPDILRLEARAAGTRER